ncbi:MAG: methyltransferase domain-containing protein, partial [Deltaproteobacteria bacterium]|nr:methyltransferase domain-containing protein [Deltaproteobacteria bacterium]
VADVIYALDMFHMVSDPAQFLNELHRLIKKDGFLIIDNGHQSRKKAKEKLACSNLWQVAEESKDHLKCVPV